MDNIKNVIKDVMGSMSQRQPSSHLIIERMLEEILQDQELEHIKMVGYKEGQVLFHVDSPAWLYQMNIKKNKLIERLKETWSGSQATLCTR